MSTKTPTDVQTLTDGNNAQLAASPFARGASRSCGQPKLRQESAPSVQAGSGSELIKLWVSISLQVGTCTGCKLVNKSCIYCIYICLICYNQKLKEIKLY